MKKILSVLLAVGLLVCCCVTTQAAVTSVRTPTEQATLLFFKQFGKNYKAAPTPPIVVGDTLLVVSGVKLYKLDAATGEEINSVKTAGSTLYATVSPVYADGKILVTLDDGTVQAFDYETMQSLWVYTDPLGGQALCPITVADGCVYTGFWNDETDYGNFVCLALEDGQAKWTYKSLGGFYGAGCAVTERYVVVGTDDGERGSLGTSQIVSLDKTTGDVISAVAAKGDLRSVVTYSEETNAFYVSSKAGYIYKLSAEPSGKLTAVQTYTADGALTATPVVYNGRLYAGCQSGAAGKFLVLDAASLHEIYTCEMQGYAQATMLLSTGYESESGNVYIYTTYNALPGGVTVFTDSVGQTAAQRTELFVPEAQGQQYCISPIAVGEDGTLYYKNDSGMLFALKKTEKKKKFFEKVRDAIRRFLVKLAALFGIQMKGAANANGI